jgi:L-aspartate oxidase
MTAKAGVLRNGVLLREAAETLEAWAAVVRPEGVPGSEDPRAHEDANLLLAAQLLVRAAQERRESLGAHYRSDSPLTGTAVEDDGIEELEESYRMRPKVSLVRD